ncbi:hypothetical protein ACFFX0_11730 [Citricoccus parietis]|uniref:Uncharacterized protein n=1 Tax=Citricoccus parietis TaxID=592307 RepID=A0ABV5FYS0_9MICC
MVLHRSGQQLLGRLLGLTDRTAGRLPRLLGDGSLLTVPVTVLEARFRRDRGQLRGDPVLVSLRSPQPLWFQDLIDEASMHHEADAPVEAVA